MADRQVLFRDDMVAAILAGQKDVTRRTGATWATVQPGTRLWAREAWRPVVSGWSTEVEYRAGGRLNLLDVQAQACMSWAAEHGGALRFRGADPAKNTERWRPSIHMPRWASRLTLEVMSVTEERSLASEVPQRLTTRGRWVSDPGAALVPGVTPDEAKREGFADRAAFIAAWRTMHADHSGPVYRIEFKPLETP